MPNPLSDAVSKAFEEYGDVVVPEGLPDEVAEIYQAGAERRCMCCHNNIGTDAVVTISENGMDQVYCSHRCQIDLMVLGWMMQNYDDLTQAVKFRGNAER